MGDNRISALLDQPNPWVGNTNDIWMMTSVSLKRNLEKFQFPAKLDTDSRAQIVGLIGKELMASPSLEGTKVFKSEECNSVDKEFLFEHFLTQQSYAQAHHGEAFILDQSGMFLAIVNIGNHLEMVRLANDRDLNGCLASLAQAETHLGKSLDYAFSSSFGFLTAKPSQCGTGLKVRVYLQLPAMLKMGRLEEINDKYITDEVSISGITGDPEDFVGDLVVVTNTYSLGVTEEEILSQVNTFATQLLVEEKGLRERLKTDGDPEIKDLVSRAYGLLKHSYQLETFESLNALSLMKLAHGLSWVQGVSIAKCNELFFNCRRAHLGVALKQEIPLEELPLRRSEYLHQALSRLTLSL